MFTHPASKILAAVGGVAAVGLGVMALTSKKKSGRAPTAPIQLEAGKSFDELFHSLVSQFVADVRNKYSLSDTHCQRIKTMFEYTILGGKCYRGHLTVSAAEALCQYRGLDFSRVEQQAIVLGWCIEILQACFLVADDVMDASTTRRGQPCWYKVPTVQLDAVNDSLILESFIYFLLKTYFPAGEGHSKLVALFQQVSLETQLGQMLDLTSQPQGRKDSEILKNFSLKTYQQIVRYKTACYTFYLPIASAILLCAGDENQDQELATARSICMKLGEKFQIQDDYLDCFGDPKVIGKIGTDIQDHKCSWLCVQALLAMNTQQRTNFEGWYGKEDEQSVASVKALYAELGLPAIYDKQEEASYNELIALIEEASVHLPDSVFTPILNKIHKRQK